MIVEEDSAPVTSLQRRNPNVRGVLWVWDREQRAFEALRERWNKLFAWGVGDKIKEPTYRQMVRDWQSFQELWENENEDPDQLSTRAKELAIIENRARDLGYEKPGPDVTVPDVEDNPVLKTVDDLGKGLEDAGVPVPTANAPQEAKEALDSALDKAKKGWEGIPVGWKVGGGLGLFGLALWKLQQLTSSVSRAVESFNTRKTP